MQNIKDLPDIEAAKAPTEKGWYACKVQWPFDPWSAKACYWDGEEFTDRTNIVPQNWDVIAYKPLRFETYREADAASDIAYP